jgi:hypothetical protein
MNTNDADKKGLNDDSQKENGGQLINHPPFIFAKKDFSYLGLPRSSAANLPYFADYFGSATTR